MFSWTKSYPDKMIIQTWEIEAKIYNFEVSYEIQ